MRGCTKSLFLPCHLKPMFWVWKQRKFKLNEIWKCHFETGRRLRGLQSSLRVSRSATWYAVSVSKESISWCHCCSVHVDWASLTATPLIKKDGVSATEPALIIISSISSDSSSSSSRNRHQRLTFVNRHQSSIIITSNSLRSMLGPRGPRAVSVSYILYHTNLQGPSQARGWGGYLSCHPQRPPLIITTSTTTPSSITITMTNTTDNNNLELKLHSASYLRDIVPTCESTLSCQYPGDRPHTYGYTHTSTRCEPRKRLDCWQSAAGTEHQVPLLQRPDLQVGWKA